jgi:hypothetical protein
MSACTGYQYIASPQYVPFNTKKGDLKANLSFNHMQLGYTVSNHMSVFATGYWREGGTFINFESWATKEGGGADRYEDRSHEVNAGASYFTRSKRFIYEVHLGAGGGKVFYLHNKDLRESYRAEFDADKANVFIQPSFSYIIPINMGNYVQFGAFAKIVGQQYYNIKDNSTNDAWNNVPFDKADQYFHNRRSRNLYFAEPGVCLRAGSRWVKGNVVVSFPASLQGTNVRHRPTNLYLSAFVNLNLLRKKNKTPPDQYQP